jgi:pyruvate kinase
VFESTDDMVQNGEQRLRELGLVSAGETVVYVAGARTNTPGGTDMLKIHRFE